MHVETIGVPSRFILADTDLLHRKIAQMSCRIRQLEDALAILQATVLDHPLLKEDFLKMKFGSVPGSSSIDEEAESKVLDALGPLTMEISGESRYYGRSGGVEVCHVKSSFVCFELTIRSSILGAWM